MTRIIEFSPPIYGIDGEFNTFRLGVAWAKRLTPGERVLLVDKKNFSVMCCAEVTGLEVGVLREMGELHGFRNHNQKHLPQEGAGERITAAMIKRYGPNKCCETSKVTVIHLRRELGDGDVADDGSNGIREVEGCKR